MLLADVILNVINIDTAPILYIYVSMLVGQETTSANNIRAYKTNLGAICKVGINTI